MNFPNKTIKPIVCDTLGSSALRAYSGMASLLFPEQALSIEFRLPGR